MRDFINKISKKSMFRVLVSKHWRVALAIIVVSIVGVILIVPIQHAQAADTNTGDSSAGGVLNFFGKITGLTLGGLIYVLILVPLGWLLGVAGTFADWMMQPTYIINSTVVQVGWGITRDFANMFFILILLGIALDYILFQSFGVKRALPTLILVALLINFSLPIAGIFIDFANVFSNFFIGKITGDCISLGKCSFTMVIANNLNLTALYDVSSVSNFVTDEIFAAFLMLGTIFTLFALGIMFLLRTGWLYALLILLPMVLVLMPFPKTSQYFGRWTHRFFSQTFFAPVAMFFLYLSMLVFQANVNPGAQNAVAPGQMSFLINNAQAETTAWTQGIGGGFIEQVIKYIIVWFFMLGSLTAAQAMGATGAGAALGMIKGAQKWVGGKVKGAGKTLGREALRRGKADERTDKAAQTAEKHWYLGGKFAGKALRGISGRTSEQLKKMGEPTAQEKAFFDRLSANQQIDQLKNWADRKVSPRLQALAANLATSAKQKNLMKLDSDGNPLVGENRELFNKIADLQKTYSVSRIERLKFRRSNPVAAADYIKSEYQKKATAGAPLTGTGAWKDPSTGQTLQEALRDAFSFGISEMKDMKGSWTEQATEEWMRHSGSSYILREASRIGDMPFQEHVNKILDRIADIMEKSEDKRIDTEKGLLVDFEKTQLYKSLDSGNLDDIVGEKIATRFRSSKKTKKEKSESKEEKEGSESE